MPNDNPTGAVIEHEPWTIFSVDKDETVFFPVGPATKTRRWVLFPERIDVKASLPDGMVVELTLESERPSWVPRITDLHIATSAMPNDVLRSVGLGGLLAEIVAQVGYPCDEYEDGTLEYHPNPPQRLSAEEVAAVLRRRKRRVSDVDLYAAVDAYVAAREKGTPDPTLATARVIKTSRATAGRRLHMARRLGFLEEV